MNPGQELPLPSLQDGGHASGFTDRETLNAELEQLYDVPVTISAILGYTRMPVGDLLKIGPGSLLELDRKVGEAIDIRVNDRLVARGEVVLVEDRLGVTMTEIVIPT